jgi:hypothetical protein
MDPFLGPANFARSFLGVVFGTWRMKGTRTLHTYHFSGTKSRFFLLFVCLCAGDFFATQEQVGQGGTWFKKKHHGHLKDTMKGTRTFHAYHFSGTKSRWFKKNHHGPLSLAEDCVCPPTGFGSHNVSSRSQ